MHKHVLLTNYCIFYRFCCRRPSVMLLPDVMKLRLVLLLELGAP